MDKIVKEDENFTWFETEAGMGYVASKHAYFHTQPERSKREDCDLVYVDQETGERTPIYGLFDKRRCGALNIVETQ